MVAELAELRIRNLQAFEELQAFNDNGEFLFRHPLIVNYSVQKELEDLLKRDPAGYLKEYSNVQGNVKRYSSFLNNKRRDKEQNERDSQNLKKHKERLELMEEIMKKKNAL